MTDKEIVELYDRQPDLLLSDLARLTGKTVKQLKDLLLK